VVSKVITRIEDDLDGSEAAETVQFSVDGVEYEIDLSKANADKFRNSFGDYISHSRKVGGGRRGRKSASSDGVDIRAVRKWAASNGIEVSTRGRVPADIIERYRAAGN
jgi:nucleoid-associated protein Lsr2